MSAATCAACATARGADVTRVLFDRRSLLVLAALAAAGVGCLRALGPLGLFVDAALWLLALPLVLAPLGRALGREWIAVVFVFASAAFVENLDDLLHVEHGLSLAMVLLSAAYVVQRWSDARHIVRSPLVVLLIVFNLQQIASAWLFANDDPLQVIQNRLSVLAGLVAAATLARRPDGARLLAALIVVGGLVSIPIMFDEVMDPDLVLFSWSAVKGPLRAGGLFGQANAVGCALSFAVAALLALRARGEVGRGATLALGGAVGFGVLACASRGALFVIVALIAAAAWVAAYRRAQRPPLASALLAAALLAVTLPALAGGIVQQSRRLEELGFEQVERLGEVVLALSGSTAELVDDDSSRLKLARGALSLIAERPLFGRGTGNFRVKATHELRSHVEFLEILGENGVVGLAFYLLFLAALVRATLRVPPAWRASAGFVVAAWLANHFDNHNILEYRFYLFPVAYACGLATTAAP